VLAFQPDPNPTPMPLRLREPVPYRALLSSATAHVCAGTVRVGLGADITGDLTAYASSGVALRFLRGVSVGGGAFTGGGAFDGIACTNNVPIPQRPNIAIGGICDDTGFNDGVNFCEAAARRVASAEKLLASATPDLDLGDVSVRRGQTVELPPFGTFPEGRSYVHMDSLRIGKGATLRLKGASPFAEVVVLVEEPFLVRSFGGVIADASTGFGPQRVLILVKGVSSGSVHIGRAGRLDGTVLALGSGIRVLREAQVHGALIAGGPVHLGRGAQIDQVPFIGQ